MQGFHKLIRKHIRGLFQDFPLSFLAFAKTYLLHEWQLRHLEMVSGVQSTIQRVADDKKHKCSLLKRHHSANVIIRRQSDSSYLYNT